MCRPGLCSNRSCGKETIEKDKEVHMAFVGLEKAYDNVGKENLWMVLERYVVEGKLLRAIQVLYDGGGLREGWAE